MKRTPVTSSTLSSVGYCPTTATLEIKFLRGAVYQYSNVPQNIYDELMKASSKGKFFNTYIKRAYPYLRVG